MSKLTHLLCLLLAVAPSPPAVNDRPAKSAEASLEIRFIGIKTPRGAVMLSLFADEAAHDQGGEPVLSARVAIEGEEAVARLSGLAAGHYAVRAFQDVDGDGEFDTNPFGLPIEPFAFSNDAMPQGGPALWEATSFVVGPGANSITITFR
jgi:uncharacterized protein (DUF2141 family)